ncbi:MAG: MFS family permease [Verrucomicrobiales bacterium]|jgi:MFS family permease
MLLVTMAMSALAFFAIAVAASELQDEFDISKLELGLLGAVNTLVGGLFAPSAGRISDRIGGRSAMGATLLIAGCAAVLMALSQSYLTLLAAMAIGGPAQGFANPACNRAIATGIVSRQRGVITGVKQSGVQFAVFVAGFVVPWLIQQYDWRAAMWLVAGVSFTSLAGLSFVTELAGETRNLEDEAAYDPKSKLPTFVTQVAIFGFLLGLVGGGLGRFLPLFAEEEVGFSIARAGQVFGLQGLVAIPCRLLSGVALDRGVRARSMLVVMAIGGGISVLLILAATSGSSSLLWIGAVLGGMTLGSWNTAANLSMIRQKRHAGRATGLLMLGFMIGNTLGAPAVGWSVDSFGYTPAWIASAGFAFIGAAVIARRAPDHARYA